MLPDTAALQLVGLTIAIAVPVGILTVVGYLITSPRGWRMPRNPVKRLHALERARRAQAAAYDWSSDPCQRRGGR